ncbi:CaiB/BaiF CoA-transferase family protein [Novosphingobium sp. ERW19]|uniref:CaiB/BaiF CoA transferase family protein n=1 Tax=Novosphingobium sp. ERW19 TaxID=2726186 RepID=UPI001456B8F9|nr:CaiB/BaiF CoA-transferase family protein [Novosphingobium sp. ERW19]NLR40247.1 CoA transferase [Novosphingobium sp. ERW19]
MIDDAQVPMPLKGVRVVEFTHMVMGPAAGAMLASLGADVVRIEPVGGDSTRRLLGSGAGYFPMYNRHKASVCLDLKSEDGLAVARDLAANADVLIENFRPGALDRLGLGYEALSAINPGLIYCSEKGFLPGPYENRTALDEVAQMMGGLAYMTGPPGRPLRAGASVIDVTGGMFGVVAILAALNERHSTGRGQMVQSALFETTVYLIGQHMAQKAVTGRAADPMPARISAWAIYDVFETRDDPIFIGVVTDALWEKFCKLFGLDDLWADESIRANNARVQARDRILPRIRELIAGFTRAELIDRLEGSGLPFAPIARPQDMFDDPHLNASGGLEPVTLADGTQTALPALPIMMGGRRPGTPSTLPEPGADTRGILAGLGYSEDRIEALFAGGAVG